MMLVNQKIVVVIPAFNESKAIEKVVKEINPYVNEIIVVNDGSHDDTGLKAKEVGAIVIDHKKNQGYDASIEDGFQEALKRKASIIVTFDADGQHQPEDIKRLIEPIITGKADIVVGQRRHALPLSEKFFGLYTNFRFGIKDPLCGLKAYTSKVYEDIGHFDTLGSMGTQLMMEALHRGFRIEFAAINVRPQADRARFYFKRLKTSYKILKATMKVILFLRR
jgi:glycosyltransferase involved in cell wall biosynthesis